METVPIIARHRPQCGRSSSDLDLHKEYEEEAILFKDLLKQTLDEKVFKTKHYRHAFEVLSTEEGVLKVNGDDYTRSNNVACSEDDTELVFLEKKTKKRHFPTSHNSIIPELFYPIESVVRIRLK